MNNMEVPKFLTDPVTQLTKPNEEVMHRDKLMEIAASLDEKDAEIIFEQTAKKYPIQMLKAVENAIQNQTDTIAAVSMVLDKYYEN